MYFITTKRMLEVCFSAHPNIQYRTFLFCTGEDAAAAILSGRIPPHDTLQPGTEDSASPPTTPDMVRSGRVLPTSVKFK